MAASDEFRICFLRNAFPSAMGQLAGLNITWKQIAPYSSFSRSQATYSSIADRKVYRGS